MVLPGEMLHFDAGRPKSVHALNRAMDEEGLIFVSAQKDPKISEIEPDDIYETGTLCALRQVLPMPGDSARVFVEGVCRALAVKVRDDGEGLLRRYRDAGGREMQACQGGGRCAAG